MIKLKNVSTETIIVSNIKLIEIQLPNMVRQNLYCRTMEIGNNKCKHTDNCIPSIMGYLEEKYPVFEIYLGSEIDTAVVNSNDGKSYPILEINNIPQSKVFSHKTAASITFEGGTTLEIISENNEKPVSLNRKK